MHPFGKNIFQGLVNIRFAKLLPIVLYNSKAPVKMNTHLLVGIPIPEREQKPSVLQRVASDTAVNIFGQSATVWHGMGAGWSRAGSWWRP